jgi:transposase
MANIEPEANNVIPRKERVQTTEDMVVAFMHSYERGATREFIADFLDVSISRVGRMITEYIQTGTIRATVQTPRVTNARVALRLADSYMRDLLREDPSTTLSELQSALIDRFGEQCDVSVSTLQRYIRDEIGLTYKRATKKPIERNR